MTSQEYGEAYEAGFAPTVRVLLSKGIPHDLAEEVAQAAWARGWERISQLRERNLLKTWVITIALNMYRRAAWAASRRQPLEDRTGGAEIDFAAIDLGMLLRSCRSSDRTLLLHQLNGFSTAELAVVVGTTESAVRIRLLRARRSARSLIEGKKTPKAESEIYSQSGELVSHEKIGLT
jgi:RNA polymerase sigma-70 factor, ECF subfamily